MTAKILDGKAMAQQVRQQLAAKVTENQTEAFLAGGFGRGQTKPAKFMTATRKRQPTKSVWAARFWNFPHP